MKPFDEKQIKSKITKRYRIILSKFTVIGYRFSPAEFITKYKQSTNPSCASNSYRTAVQTALKIGIKEGILKKEIGENKVPSWFKELDSILYWQDQLRSSKYQNLEKIITSTKKTYLNHLWNFNLWLIKHAFFIQKIIPLENNMFKTTNEKTSFSDVEQLLRILESPLTKQSDVIKIIKKFLLDPIHEGKKPGSISVTFSAIISYFDKNEQTLKMRFDPRIKYDKQQEEDEISLSLNELMTMLTVGKPSITEKAVFLCKFHRGLDSSTFADRFNFHALKQIYSYFKTENYKSWDLDMCPVPIKLTRIKNRYLHTGFLERDAIKAIQDYLEYAESNNTVLGNVLFVNKLGKPISNSWITSHFFDLANRCGIQQIVSNYKFPQYRIGSHEVRDLLKSTLIDSGCKEYVADHVIGHMPKDSYEKQTKLYPETLRKEYAKASKRLNIFTKFTSVVNGTDDSDELKAELNQKIQEINEIKDKFVIESAVKKRDEIFAARQQEMMKNMQRQIDDLSRMVTNSKGSHAIEFCCVNCSIIHNKESCPNCNSKIRRIYDPKTTI